jgi:4-hydroxybenzoate polyprenyltransferase
MLPAPADVAELVRLPAVLSVPGDVLVGAAASGQMRDVPRTAGLVAASSCLYLAGMALNDYADREVDAVERPGRPIPSGRVSPGFALGLAGALTLGAAALSVAADGPRALAVTAPLAAAVWGYDLVLKSTPVASTSMSACRGLDVMMGAGAHGAASAVPAAAVVAAHIAVVTEVSRREVTGGDADVPKKALAATVGVAAAGALLARRAPRVGRAAALGLVGAARGRCRHPGLDSARGRPAGRLRSYRPGRGRRHVVADRPQGRKEESCHLTRDAGHVAVGREGGRS